jgi:hypothetical protein
MQNCFVKKTFLSKHFNSSLVICDTIFFVDKNNVRTHRIQLEQQEKPQTQLDKNIYCKTVAYKHIRL